MDDYSRGIDNAAQRGAKVSRCPALNLLDQCSQRWRLACISMHLQDVSYEVCDWGDAFAPKQPRHRGIEKDSID